MTAKDFFKPSAGKFKIVGAFICISVILFIVALYNLYPFSGEKSVGTVAYDGLLIITFPLFLLAQYTPWLLFLVLPWWYLIACVLVSAFSRRKRVQEIRS
jgi:hypothetical protein